MTTTRGKSLGSCETTLFDVPAWTPDQLDRRACAERGECIVANFRKNNGRRIAEAGGRYVRIDRKTDWENAFEIPHDGERTEVGGKFAKFYLPYKTGLLADPGHMIALAAMASQRNTGLMLGMRPEWLRTAARRSVRSNVALQYHIMKLWPELEVNWTYWANGQRRGPNQVFF
jgi:hypothetical protein